MNVKPAYRKWLAAAVLLFIVLVWLVVYLATARADPHYLYQRAGLHFNAGELRSAKIDLLNAIKMRPEWAEAHMTLAEVQLGLFAGASAESEARKALQYGMDQGEVRPFLGHALWLQGRLDDALAELQKPVAERYRAYADRILGRVMLDRADYNSAQTFFDKALEQDAGNSRLWVDIAFFRMRSGNMAEAREAADRAIALNPNDPRALQMRGELARTEEGLVASLPWFARGLAVAPDDVPLLVQYGSTLGDAGQHSAMLETARKILTLDSRNGMAFYMEAVIAARGGQFGLARSLLDKAGDVGGQPAGLLLRGVSEYGDGNYNQALKPLQLLVELQPNNLFARRLCALALHRSGDQDAAAAMLKPLLSIKNPQIHDQMLAGRIAEALANQPEAIVELAKAAEMSDVYSGALPQEVALDSLSREASQDPHNAEVLIPYMRGLINAGRNAEALALGQRLSKENPGVADAQRLVGDILLTMGRPQEALSAYRSASKLAFNEPVMIGMAQAQVALGRPDLARAEVLAFLQSNPANIAARRLLMGYALDAGDWAAAAINGDILRQRLGNGDFLLLANLARAYDGLGQLDKAAAAARLSYQVQPASALATHIYGYALLRRGGTPQAAVDLLEKGAKLAPENAFLRYHLARAYLAANKRGKAREQLVRALQTANFTDRDKASALLKRL